MFAANAFADNTFAVEKATGGSLSAGERKRLQFLNAQVFNRAADAVEARYRKAVEEEPSVVPVIEEVAKAAIEEEKPKSNYSRMLRNKVRALELEVNIAYVRMVEAMIQEYQEELVREAKRRKDDEELAILVLFA